MGDRIAEVILNSDCVLWKLVTPGLMLFVVWILLSGVVSG